VLGDVKGCQPFEGWQPWFDTKVANPNKIKKARLEMASLKKYLGICWRYIETGRVPAL
jgi:hypothetical protein